MPGAATLRPLAGTGLTPPHPSLPRYIDDEVDMCQSIAILRHVGRKWGLYGASRAETARVDEVRWLTALARALALWRSHAPTMHGCHP